MPRATETGHRETLESEQDEAALRKRVMAPNLVCVMHYERLEAGGGPMVPLAGVRSVVLGGGRERVVRDGAEVTVTVEDPYASRRHARLLLDAEGGIELEDLGSRNGTTHLGSPTTRARLADGDWFEAGHSVFMLRFAPPPAPAQGDDDSSIGPTHTFSPVMRALAQRLSRLAPTQVSILLLGETGTGKEVVARHVHQRSERKGAFVAVNCGGLAEGVLESELFGHRKGAFTGAVSDRRGYVEAADSGTLFLDEVGELPLSAQTRLLRVLEAHEVVPVGGTAPTSVDVRILAATHRDLDRLVAEGRFRADLYARLAGYVAKLPRLADRREDLGELISHPLRTAGRTARCSVAAGRALLRYGYPLNVRELHKAMEAALILAPDRAIELDDLPPAMRAITEPDRAAAGGDTPLDLDPEDAKLRAELVEALRACDGNVSQVAQKLGKHRQQVQRWIRRLRIRPSEIDPRKD